MNKNTKNPKNTITIPNEKTKTTETPIRQIKEVTKNQPNQQTGQNWKYQSKSLDRLTTILKRSLDPSNFSTNYILSQSLEDKLKISQRNPNIMFLQNSSGTLQRTNSLGNFGEQGIKNPKPIPFFPIQKTLKNEPKSSPNLQMLWQKPLKNISNSNPHYSFTPPPIMFESSSLPIFQSIRKGNQDKTEEIEERTQEIQELQIPREARNQGNGGNERFFFSTQDDIFLNQVEEDNPGIELTLENAEWYEVEFKSGRRDYYFCKNTLKLKESDFVIVEADRGLDLGRVAAYVPLQNLEDNLEQLIDESIFDEKKPILRKAFNNEIASLSNKIEDEKKALLICINKVAQRDLPMKVLDAEFQFDRKKLTFYFSANSRIDFRDLVKDLFKIYKTRIWMKQTHTKEI
ncbi:protein psp1 [Anaeramoeba ignava]|uniref:Protein psp1 n=1 Tax=Anaeramoeba ignava TaxID=1746090 RepID=A0A9Q0RFY6_ANAIG|nr:protein psp1 [Anaeramoeba ignava]